MSNGNKYEITGEESNRTYRGFNITKGENENFFEIKHYGDTIHTAFTFEKAIIYIDNRG